MVRLSKAQRHGRTHSAGRSRTIIKGALSIVAGLLLLCLPAFSQVNFGNISGNVSDPSGGVIAGATITVANPQTGLTRTPDVAAGNPVVGSGDARAIQLGFKLAF
jgi:hypothetical protein